MDRELLERIITYIGEYRAANDGLSPTVREIAAACYIGTTTASKYLSILEAQGRIIRDGVKARSIRLLNRDS